LVANRTLLVHNVEIADSNIDVYGYTRIDDISLTEFHIRGNPGSWMNNIGIPAMAKGGQTLHNPLSLQRISNSYHKVDIRILLDPVNWPENRKPIEFLPMLRNVIVKKA